MENENIENMALYQSLVRDNEAKKEFEKAIGVYVKINEEGFVTDVNSDIFSLSSSNYVVFYSAC